MAKEQLKRAIRDEQDEACALSGVALPDETKLFDTDRITPKVQNGTYVDRDNVRAVDPVAHMVRHGNLREREEGVEQLKAAMDHRAQTIKARNKLGNQLLAYERRTDHMSPEVLADLEAWRLPIEQRLAELDKDVARLVATLAQHDPLVLATLGVPGIGPITVAGLTVYVDLAKAPSASSLWKYVGLHVASHERYVKGVKGGGNKTLRTILFTTATSAVKMGDSSPYRIVYDRVKARLAASEKIVSSRGTDGKLREVAWKDAKPSHRHGAAMRAIIKHFLADYWFVGRTLAGLPTRSLYVEEQLGHTGIIAPQDRGWSA